VENILGAGRRQRFVHGLILAAATVATAVTLVVVSAGPGWFLLLFVLGAGAAMLLLQARDST
jgi:hypothetical protein